MENIYTVEELRKFIADIHANISEVMGLADKGIAIVEGYNGYKVNVANENNIKSPVISEESIGKIKAVKAQLSGIYEECEEILTQKITPIDGSLEEIKSSPISMVDTSIKSRIANADSKEALKITLKIEEKRINDQIERILTGARNITLREEITFGTYAEEIEEKVQTILNSVNEGLSGISLETTYDRSMEDKYSDK